MNVIVESLTHNSTIIMTIMIIIMQALEID